MVWYTEFRLKYYKRGGKCSDKVGGGLPEKS